MRILAIEDQPSSLELVFSHLTKHGFIVDSVQPLAKALLQASDFRYELILLDLAPRSNDGARLLDYLRQEQSLTSVMFLGDGTAADRVCLLDAGADDYLVKPLDLDELVSRIRAIVRRGGSRKEQSLSYGDLSFDPHSWQARINGRVASITHRREAALLESLLRRAGEPVKREMLLLDVYGAQGKIDSNALDVHVHRLRQILTEAKARVSINTVRRFGYALHCDPNLMDEGGF